MKKYYVKVNRHFYDLMLFAVMAATMGMIGDNIHLKLFYLGICIYPLFQILWIEASIFVEWIFQLNSTIISAIDNHILNGGIENETENQ